MFLTVFCAILAVVAPVRYEDFGAVGDGVHDDRLAIVATHAAANAKGAPVRAKDGATYYVGSGTNTALVATDVDFGSAHFVVDDRKVRIEDRRSPLFRVVSLKPSVELKGLGAIRAGQPNLGVRLPAKCFVYLKCDKVRRYFRKGLNQNNGTPQQEALIAAANGDIDPSTPVLWDYPEVTAILAKPIDEKCLMIRGGDFLTCANQAESKYNYHLRDFAIERSNVLVEKVKHRISDESDHGAPYHAFILVDKCADVTVRDCAIGYMGLSSIGFGTFTVENTTIRSHAFVNLRSDYGSTWKGKFVIRNCRYEPMKPGQGIGSVVNGSNDGTHDFGYDCHLPEVDVDGLYIDDKANPGGAVLFCDTGGALSDKAKHPIAKPVCVTLKNVTTASGRPMKTFANPAAFAQTKVVVGN